MQQTLLRAYPTAIPSSALKVKLRDAWVAQSAKCLTLAQIKISRFVDSRPTSGSALTVQSLIGILSPSLCPFYACPPFLSQNK